MARARKGPKPTASGWPYVYNQPKKAGGPDRFVFWTGRKGDPKYVVRGNDISSPAFLAAYARFQNGQPPYEDRPVSTARRNPNPDTSRTDKDYAYGTLGWLLLRRMKMTDFERQKNRRAIEGQFLWIMKEPVKKEVPNGPKVGHLPLKHIDSVALTNLLARKVSTTTEKKPDRTGLKVREVLIVKGDKQANNILKWLRPVGKMAVVEKFWTVNHVDLVEKWRGKRGGFKMWTDEVWEAVCKVYSLGTKPRLVFDLAGFSGQRRGDVYVLGWNTPACTFLKPDEECPYGSLEIRQEKGADDDGEEAQIAYVPIIQELHDSLEAARVKGILGANFFIRQDHKDLPYTKESLGNMVRKWLDKAEEETGVSTKGYSLHGLRKLFVCRLIERGCEPHVVMSATGHQTLKEIDRYAKGYFREKMKSKLYAKWREHAIKQGIPVSTKADEDDGLNEAA